MIDPTLVRGALELEHTASGLLPHRLPAWARAQTDDPQLALVEAQPAGVRLAMRTAATRLELVVLPTKRRYVGAPRPDGSYDVLVDGALVQRLQAPGGKRARRRDDDRRQHLHRRRGDDTDHRPAGPPDER